MIFTSISIVKNHFKTNAKQLTNCKQSFTKKISGVLIFSKKLDYSPVDMLAYYSGNLDQVSVHLHNDVIVGRETANDRHVNESLDT